MGTSSKDDVRALSRLGKDWTHIKWRKVKARALDLQMRIAKAVCEGRQALARKLQFLLTRSLAARLLAIKRVTANRGHKTPGTDGELWITPRKKMQGIKRLRRQGYLPRPLRRVYIPKKSGKLRPLGIPTACDRAMQTLHAMGLLPIAETRADRHSYGFRPYRSCADAIGQCFNVLSRWYSPEWILEADISGCFDNISHPWMIKHIPMDGRLLSAWLAAGYMDKGVFHQTTAGTPQGGTISPILANMALDGLEAVCHAAVLSSPICRRAAKVNVIRYADDFIITGCSKELLRDYVLPAIEKFLAERGLTLSREKTKITQVEEGFDFLGQNIRKRSGKLAIQPSKTAAEALLCKTQEIILGNRGRSVGDMIVKLNPVIRGWANYHRHAPYSDILSKVDDRIFRQVWNALRKRHGSHGKLWLRKTYFQGSGTRRWSLNTGHSSAARKVGVVTLVRASEIVRVPHVKIRSEANPFDPQWKEYFTERTKRRRTPSRQAGTSKRTAYWWNTTGPRANHVRP